MNLIKTTLLLSTLCLAVCCSNTKSKESTKTNTPHLSRFSTEQELANAFLNSFAQHDTGMMQYLITDEEIAYAATEIAKEFPDTSTTIDKQVDRARQELTHKIIPAYKTSLKSLQQMISVDNVDLATCTFKIDTVPSKKFKGSTTIIKGGAEIDVITKEQKHYNLKMYSFMRIKDKWLILGPKWEWQNQPVRDR